jgi:phosphopentomutase
MKDRHGVGRIIARPFVGAYPHFVRTANRHDFSLEPTGPTMMDTLLEWGYNVMVWAKSATFLRGWEFKRAPASIKTMRTRWKKLWLWPNGTSPPLLCQPGGF